MSRLENNEDFSSVDDEESITENESSCADSQELQVSEGDEKETKASDSESEKDKKSSDKELYKQIVDKLGVESENSQESFVPSSSLKKESHQEKNLERAQYEAQIKNTIEQDFAKIQNLVQLGLVNSLQGQDLKQQVLKKAFDRLVQNEKSKQNLSSALQNLPVDKNEVFNEFNKEHPDFFLSEGRKDVLDYLKSDNVIVGKDELKKISVMVENIEKTAVDRYLKKIAHEENLKNSNELAKQRLTANAQSSGFKDRNLSRTFTREQIGKMSSTEFAKYEPSIMEQLRKGLIK